MAEGSDDVENVIEQDGRRFVDAEYISRLLKNSNVDEDARQQILEGLQGGIDHEDSDSSMSDYGELEQPPIRQQLKNILQAYPDGSQILRELVQNAEDANASIVRIVHDQRQIEVDLNRKRQLWLKSFKTPAVFLYNDELFRKNDWKGIRKVYSSVKEEDSLKIGRYGLGFKSVFHMTDTPIIISGDRLLMISPLEDQSWKVCHTIQLKKVFNKRKYHKLKEMLDQILGPENALFGIMEESFRKGNYKGTLFWFPLRQSIPVEDPISRTIYTQNKVDDLFHSFHREASMVLLFLKHVEQISLHTLEENSTWHEMFSVEIKSCNNENISKERRKISDRLKSCPQNHVVQKSIDSVFQARILLTEESGSQETHWLISTVYQGSDEMSDEMRSLLDNNELRYQPYVGVALPFDSGGFSPHVFCFLPLPLEKVGQSLTNLPFHVNGSFALDSNRRHMNWPTNDRTEDKDVSLKWNRLMITEVLPTAYVNLMTDMVVTSHVQKGMIYKAMPDPEAVDKKWAILLPKLFSRLFEEPIFSTESGQHINFSEAVFSIISTTGNIGQCHTKNLLDTVQMYCPYLVRIPSEESHVFQILQSPYTPSSPKVITPKYINQLLLQDHEGKYKELSREHKLTLLVFLTSEGDFDYVDSLELMPVDSREKEFKVFERANTGKATYFLATQEQKEVLPELEDILLTPCDLKMPEAETVIETLSKEGLYGIKHITDDDIFQELLSRSLETITEKSTGTGKSFSLKNDRVGDNWLKRLWEYLSKHIDDFETVAHLPILPIFDQYGKFSHLQCLTGQYIAKAEHQICLSDSILHILQTLQICILYHVPDYVASCREYKTYVVSPTSDGILHILKLCLSSNSQIEMANKINRQCTSQDMLELAVFLTKNELPDEVSEFMKHANLFETTENEKDKAHELGSVITCNKMLPSLPWTFPVRFPRKFLVFNKKTLLLAERLGVQKLDEMELVEVMLREIDNEESYGFQDVQQFMAFFLEYYASRSSEECLHLASAVRFMCNRENVPRKANHFFDPTDKDLQILFLDETSQFPTNLSDFSRNMIENCCKIGLRSSKDVQRKDLLEVARNISNMRNASKMRMKSEMLVTFMERLDNRSLLLMKDELKEMKWVPVKQERQECYSRSLSWKGESSVVCTPGEVADAEYEYIIGSSLYVCSSNTKHILRQLSFSLEPSVQAVVRHWKHAIRSLCAQEISDKLQLKILQYLSAKLDTTNAKFVAQEMEDTPCISINGTFISPKQIYFQTAKGYESVRLEPYRYLLPGSYSHLQHFFEELGSTRYLEVENLISVLHEIKNTSSDNFESTFHLIQDVLNLIVECNPDHDLLSSVILPIESSYTGKKEFSHVPSCVHLTDPSLVAVKFPKEIKVVSQQISGKVASALGVKDVLTKLMEIGAITKIQLPKEDSDELRRRRLAVLDRKELAVRCIYSLVQELDNRGCTSVQLLFDERKNPEIQNGHVCPKLGDFYGPSLWIRHDANSTERFGGEISLLKIISDLPCVFTKRSLTMFDVTGNIFDDKQSLAGNDVGIQIGFDSENAWLLKAFPNTFTVYQDMCGRNFIDDPRQFSSFATTLYRLPLRSGNMESGENTAHFTSGNIKEFLETLSHEFEDLLIFAENLKNLQICSISGNDADTQNKTDLYHANSQTLHTVVKDDSLLEEKSINVQNNCREVNIQTKRQHCAITWLVSKCGKGSVALLKENDDDIAMGFDKHHTPGKVFNIFPLNEMTDLPIYINGNFELHDHKIDRSTSVAVEGSKKKLRTDVASSYVFLIYHLCSYPVLSETNLFSLWPRYSNDNVFDEVVRAFYDNIFHSNIELFTCKTGRKGLQQVCFLDFELRYKEPIGEIAQACFSELYNEPGKQNIDIPKSIHEQFETTNLVSRLHILQEEEFWTEVFLPSLSTNYWDQKQSQRNKLIAYCIQRSINLNLTSIIQKTWCVPTSPNGKLARPCDLVHLKPGSVLNGLFSEKDGRFVQDLDEFNSKEMREQLFRLGMMMETIHEDVLKERANSVATLYSSDPTESESRYSALLAYLKSLKNEEFAQAISAIRTIAWIPTAQTFSPYPSSAKWYGEESTHCNMDEGYLFKHRYLVGAIAYVYRDDKVLESLISRQPGEREVIDNLLRVIGDFNEDKYERGYDEIVHEAYSFFTKLNDISSDSINRLKLQKCVWTGHKFVVPAKVCLEFCLGIKKESLVPFMYCFDNQFEGIKWNPFFQTIGCHERLTLEHILQILESTNDVLQLHETGQEDLDNLLDVVLAILDTISKTELSKDHKDRLMLPVKFQNSWKMCKLLECAYISDESHLLMATSDDDANILVGKIGIETAEQLGVQSLSQRLLKDNDAEEMFCDWGQSEPLTTRIKRLLEEYSDGFSIPKELLQNADDAGATELTFIYDERENNDLRTGLLDEGMAECQGPALWVYSNSLFEEADFQNIIKLDGKTKVEETSKIGKFGLGFCSVYNITDVPSFVSGKSIVIFDPNTFHLGKAIRDKSSPGLRIKFTKGSKEFLKRFRNQFMPYNGICECDLSGEDDVPFFNGTLFRFPFRTKLQASKSEIADRPYKQSDVKELLHQFIASAGNLLLFTPNVHTIKVKHITEKAGTQNISDLCDIRKENVSNRPERPFLREVAQMDNDYLKENTAKEICEVHISLQTTEHAKNVLEMSEINSSCNWLISYSSGSRDSVQMAENLSSEGAVSVGSVAIPREYLLSNDDYSLNGALRGFYKESHIFCFLPLPIETNLPVHINGSFFVEQSRRGLRQCAGTDNKSTKDVDRWNEMLLSDAVCDSYLGLLQALPSDYYSNENGLPRDSNFDYSRFWPALFEDSVLRPLSQNFYEQVVKGDHQLLYSQIPFDTKIAMKNCIFLEANVRYDQSIGDVAFECLQNFHSEEDYCLMDMKKSIYDRFCEAGLKGSLRFLSTRDFFATVVLPNLTNEFWTNRETERDNMMVFLLKLIEVEEMPDLSNAMNQFDCIPTRPNGKLVKPHDLVDENSRLIADLFSDDDERFIQYDRNRGFKDDVVQSNLIAMGMMTNSISDDLIVSRAGSIQQVSDRKRRCEAFIRYLESLADQHLQNLEFRLKNVAWIPVIEDKPFDYPSCLKWNGQSVKLQCPSNVYSEKYRHVVGSCANIHDKDIAELLQRMNFSQKPSVKLVLEHFRAMISLDDVTECNKLTQSVHDVYKYLYENLDDLQTNDTFDEDLYPEPLVWTGNMFIEAKHVCCQFGLGIVQTALEPYIYKLVDEFTYMKPLFVFFGCSAELSFDHLLEIQKQINTKNNNADAEEDRRVMLNIVTDIAFKFKPDKHEDLKQLLLPVIHGEDRELKLASVTECVFTTDNFFLNNAEESAQQIHIMDRRIGIEVAEKLGVESLASRIMKDNDAEELGEEWGQSEPLTTRLKGLLEDYNDGFAIPKELVQNSDDAGATTVRFLYDERRNDEYMTGLIDEGMSECQGPALWVFNDACFTEDDFKNIIKLAGKTKESERSKIGKFGLGFSSVYNLTDVPSFVSGNSVVILDPKTVHLNKALRNKSSPGIRLRFGQQSQWLLKKLKNQFMPFQNIFGCDMSGTNNEPLDFKGTLFRLPLRTRKQAQDDAISSQAYSKKEMIKLLQKFASSVGTLMTFTQNINKIEVYRLPETAAEPGESVLLFEASREKIGGTGRFNMLQEIVDECLKSHSSNRKTSVEVEMNIRTTRSASELLGVETDSWKYRWFITTSTGSMETLQMAKELSDKGAVPIGSVAISDAHIKSCSKMKEEPMGFEGNNRLFCFLPLPISKITLSVFVNGCFFVEKNRKCLHLPIGDDRMSHDKEFEWNQTLLSDAVRDAYITLIAELPMEYFEQDSDGNALYQIWPRFSDNPEIFEPLTREFYQSITSYAADKRIFEMQNQKIGMNECIFLDFSLRYKDFIGNAAHDFLVFLDTATLKTVIDMPQEIYEQFKEASCDDKLPILTTLEFFSTYFFENINSDFWNGKESSRNSLVLYALSEFSENADLLAKISVAPCIPTRPHGLLRRPSELISEVHCSVLKDLFSEADERFIQSSDSQHFSDSKIMDVLVQLGLKTDSLPKDLLCERAESVIKQGTPDKQLSRCEAVLHYIRKYANTDLPYTDMKSIKFLPVQEKPKNWPMKWHSAQEIDTDDQGNVKIQFERPENIASQYLKCIVGSVLPILQISLESKFSQNVFRQLGLKTRGKLSIDDAIGQLRHISETSPSSEEDRIMKEICEETYSFIGENIMEYQDVDLSEFKERNIIYAKNKLVKPRKCIISLPADCQPEFYCMRKVWKTTSSKLLQFFRSA